MQEAAEPATPRRISDGSTAVEAPNPTSETPKMRTMASRATPEKRAPVLIRMSRPTTLPMRTTM